jgi:hypothetical protein
MALLRRFVGIADDGTKYTIEEYPTYRWEKDAAGQRCRVANAATMFMTAEGLAVLPANDGCTYQIPALRLSVRVLDEADTLRNLADVAGG